MPDKISQPLMALQELDQFIDATLLKEITLALLQLPEDFLVVGRRKSETTEGAHLSFYGETLVQLLSESYQRQPTKGELVISAEHIKGLGILLSTSSSEELANVLFYTLQKETVFAHVVAVDVLLYCLNHMTEVCLSIGALLVQHSRPHLFQFELWCLNEGRAKHLRKNMDAYLPLINAYLACAEQYSFSRPFQVSSAALHVLREAFWKKLTNFTLTCAVNEVTLLQLTVLSKLIPASHEEDLTLVIEQLPDVLVQPENLESWVVADAVSTALRNSVERMEAWKKTLLLVCMKGLTTSYSHDKDQEKMQDKEASILERLEELLNSVREVVTVEMNTFVKMGLKYRYKDCKFQRVVKVAIDLLYKNDSPASETLIPLSTVHMMITQHSLFLPSILQSRGEEPTDSHPLREALVDVLSAIVEKCPSVCESNHFAVFLGAYSATLSVTDQKILLLLKMYEKNNLSLTDFRLLLWGPAAVEHHKTRKSLGKSLWQQPSTEEILGLLDRERMSRTITNFPQHRHLHPMEGQGMIHKDERVKEMHNLYDPAFLLPLFCELVRPEFVVDCQKFVEVNALGLTVASLSSYDPNMRAAAYYVLGFFYSHLEGARFRDKRQLLYLMDVVKNGIRSENLRLTFSLTLYIAKSALQCLKPEDYMYIKINRFLLMHQYLDLKKVPDFYKLFYSFELEHKVEREWILQLLAEGLQDKYCYELYDYQRIFQVIMSYFNSPLCDESSQNQVFEILHKAALVNSAAYELIRDHSLLTWILHILEKRFLDNKRLTNIITLLNHLWQTVLGDKNTEKSTPLEKQNLFPLQIVNEFLHVFIVLIPHISTNLAVVHISQFFNTLSSILTYRVTVMKAFKEMGRFTLNESVFSNKDILMLLHKWSIIEKDTELQGNLNALAQKYKVKELIRTIKEKNKPQALSWLSYRQNKKKMEVSLEEQVDERKQDFNLEIVREHMTSILLHWVPVFLDLSIKPPVEQVGLKEIQEPQDATNGLVCTTAYIIVKWVFSSMATHSVNWHDLSKALQWLSTHVLYHAAVMEEILRDGVLKRVLFKLYNLVNDASFMVALDFDALHLFNMVMLRLLDAQGIQEPSFHQAVKKFCRLAESKENEEKKAAVVFLVSAYIADMWLGASEPEKFVTHLKAICDCTNEKITHSLEKTPKRKRPKAAEEAIISACKEIAAAALVH